MPGVNLGPVGVWWSGSWDVPAAPGLDVAAELESLGYGAIWSTGGFKAGLSSRFGRLLSSTSRMVVASGVVNIWKGAPAEICAAAGELDETNPGRFLLGLGVSHAPVVAEYRRPLATMVAYLDALDAQEPTVPKDRRVLAALGPRMLTLAAERSAGAHPYFVPVEHTAFARKVMGPGPLLAPEATVVLESDPTKARELARRFATGYLTTLPNYVGNLLRLGFTAEDVADGGSDRLLDAVIAWGDADTVAARIREHHDAGADHVCVQVVSPDEGFPMAGYRELARRLTA